MKCKEIDCPCCIKWKREVREAIDKCKGWEDERNLDQLKQELGLGDEQ